MRVKRAKIFSGAAVRLEHLMLLEGQVPYSAGGVLKMFQRVSGLAVIVTLIGSLVAISATPALAQINPTRNRLDVPVSGVVQDVGTIAGTFKISRFAIQSGALVAVGLLNATVTDTTGAVVKTIVTNAAWPVANAGSGASADAAFSCGDVSETQQACDILNLVLGPLHLDLLGLVVDLNQVVLNITAQPGGGNLLGNLLCAITGLLDGGSLGLQVVNLLNQLVGLLGAL
jgi:hypothetical protein